MTTKLVGILNLTPDSFSDGGKYNSNLSALEHAQKLINEGADIIDIGAESTRPNANLITEIEEWNRLKNIIPNLIELAHSQNKQISLDTRNSSTAKKALDLGVDIINDVSGLNDPNMGNIIHSYNKPIIINHNLGLPASPDITIDEKQNAIEEIKKWGTEKINTLKSEYNISKERIIFDVGIGFGKTPQQSLYILENIQEFKTLGTEIYVGHSRKSFLKLFSQKNTEEKDILTANFSAKIANHVNYIRIHNVSLTKKALSQG